MLRLIPAPLHRTLYRIADRVRRRWWRIAKTRRNSAFVIAFDERRNVLLVRHSYGPPVWTLPGGGIARGEDAAAAARREFAEELQCPLTDLELFTRFVRAESGSHDGRHVFTARLAGTPLADRREIVEVALFDPAALPERTTRWAAEAIRQAFAALHSNDS
jgi:8-oxo-dGTP pyrophosphatase MutT (NUDIX family)